MPSGARTAADRQLPSRGVVASVSRCERQTTGMDDLRAPRAQDAALSLRLAEASLSRTGSVTGHRLADEDRPVPTVHVVDETPVTPQRVREAARDFCEQRVRDVA
jgi:hypothetical protein